MEIDREMVTSEGSIELPFVTKEKESLVTVSNARHSRESRGSKKVDNQVVTKQTPSPSKGQGGNPSGNLSLSHSGAAKRCISDPPIDLFGAIKEFLGTNGIEVYRMQVGEEAYEVKHNGQVVRLYVQRRQTGAS